MTQFPERFGFNLADSFPSDVELFSYLFEGARISIRKAESQVQYLLFTLGQCAKDVFQAILK